MNNAIVTHGLEYSEKFEWNTKNVTCEMSLVLLAMQQETVIKAG